MNLLQIVGDALKTAPQHDTLTVRLVDSTAAQPSSVPDLVRWLGALASQMAWPLIALGLMLYLVLSRTAPRRLAKLFKPFRSFKLLGAEFVLSEEAATELGANAEEAFASYRKRAKRE